jgi:hypothetical protein
MNNWQTYPYLIPLAVIMTANQPGRVNKYADMVQIHVGSHGRTLREFLRLLHRRRQICLPGIGKSTFTRPFISIIAAKRNH